LDAHHQLVELKLGVLRHLRDMFHERALTNQILPIELITVANDLQVSESRIKQILAELIVLKLATHNPDAPPHTAVADGRAEITDAGLGYLHQVETDRANLAMNAAIASENIRLQVELAAQYADEARRANLEIPDANSTLRRAGFGLEHDL
jgi:hypothetical protein